MMSDIVKCTGESCHAREACMRFTIPANPEGQIWMSPPTKMDFHSVVYARCLNTVSALFGRRVC
jgi:hypothetical protein